MPLRSKIFLILLSAVVLYAALDYGIQRLIVFPRFIALEHDEAVKDSKRAIQAIQREIFHLDALCHDWAAWDDTYAFIKTLSDDYIESNLAINTFMDSRLNLIYYCDKEGKVVWGEIHELETGKLLDLKEFPKKAFPKTHPLIFLQTRDEPLSDLTRAGLIMTGHGPMLISSRPILRTNNEGPIRGYVMMGRILGPDQVKSLSDQTHVNFRLWPMNDEKIALQDRETLKHITEQTPFIIKERTDGHLGVYTTIADIQGSSALLFRADIARDITAKGTAALWAAVFSLLCSAVVVFLVLHIMLKQTVLDPVRRLTGHVVHVGKADDMSARLAMNRNDEIGTLANEFDCTVDRLHETRKRLLDQYYYAGMSEMAIGALHDIRNAISPLTGQISLMQKRLSRLSVGQMQMAIKELAEGNPDQKRKQDLAHFLSLSMGRFVNGFGDMIEQLEQMKEQSIRIEKILAAQERYAQGKRPIEKLTLKDVLNDSIKMLPGELINEIEIKTDPAIATIPQLKMQRIALLHIFATILGNAAESIRDADTLSGEIDIRAKMEPFDGVEMLHIWVQDNGKGIEKENLEHIFSKWISEKPGSCGQLGLHWCANTVTSMQGKLYAVSDGRGKGATMHLLIPVPHEKSESMEAV
jgi:sensor domain CHASE-containing protein